MVDVQQTEDGQSRAPGDLPLNSDNATTSDAGFNEPANPAHLPFPDNPYAPTLPDAPVKTEDASQGQSQQEHDATLIPTTEPTDHTSDDKRLSMMHIADSTEPKASPTPAPSVPKQTVPRKRPAPKGIAKKKDGKKPPPKKRKLHADEADSAKASNRLLSGSRKASQSVTPAGSSPAPSDSPGRSEASDEDNDDDDDGTVYCICRRPDDHKWMIGCDGDCEDWFHGKCIHIRQDDGDLIDKFICPNCTAKGIGVTTWKPMCRREGCRRPARLKKGAASKYCSDECGVRFFKDLAARHAGTITPPSTHTRKTAKAQDTSPTVLTATVDLGPLGGPIRPAEIKALAYSADDAEHFRRLGHSGILTPPATDPSPEADTAPTTTSLSTDSSTLPPADRQRLTEIAARKDALRARRTLLKARQRFVTWARERAARRNAEMKVKNLCAFDTRLSWSDAEFEQWWRSADGVSVFERETLDPVPQETRDDDEGQEEETTVCPERRCTRHQAWQKLVLEDIRFEEADVGDEMRRIDGEEQDIRARAAIAVKVAAAAAAAAALDGQGGDWVQVVDAATSTPVVDDRTDVVMTES